MDNSTKKRLLQWIEDNHLSVSSVALKSGIGDGNIRKPANLSCDTASAILNAYPDLSAEWLMRGVGSPSLSNHTVNISQNNNNGVLLNESMTKTINFKHHPDVLDDSFDVTSRIMNDYKERIEEYKERICELKDTIKILMNK